jgi:hypothetical protein
VGQFQSWRGYHPSPASQQEPSIGQYYEQFLELPVPFELAVMRVVGAVLEGTLVAALYWSGLLLVQLVGDIL